MHGGTKRVAVVLSGCGFLDGAEITESVSVLIHLARLGADVHCFAPDGEQPGVVNHLTGRPEAGQKRNMLEEAARIARGGKNISALGALREKDFDAVIFPGGFGAAKNLCTFASQGPECSVLPEVEKVIREFHGAGKPVGLCCIAPVLAARVLGSTTGAGPRPRVTLGEESDAAAAVRKMGAEHEAATVEEAVVDLHNRLATSPAYMAEADPHQVFTGIGQMVEATLRMVGAGAPANAAAAR